MGSETHLDSRCCNVQLDPIVLVANAGYDSSDVQIGDITKF
jgi:hypothetical protein